MLQDERCDVAVEIRRLEFLKKILNETRGRFTWLLQLQDRQARTLGRTRECQITWLKLDSDPWLWPDLMYEEDFGWFPQSIGMSSCRCIVINEKLGELGGNAGGVIGDCRLAS